MSHFQQFVSDVQCIISCRLSWMASPGCLSLKSPQTWNALTGVDSPYYTVHSMAHYPATQADYIRNSFSLDLKLFWFEQTFFPTDLPITSYYAYYLKTKLNCYCIHICWPAPMCSSYISFPLPIVPFLLCLHLSPYCTLKLALQPTLRFRLSHHPQTKSS